VIKIAEHDLGGCYVLTDTQNRFNRLDVSYDELKEITKNLKDFVEDLEKRKKRAALFKPMEELMYA
jgi:archaellum component FlaC